MKQKNFKKIVKSFDSLFENTVIKLTYKINNFFKKIKIVKFFNVLVQEKITKLADKINNIFNKKSKISNFNKLTIILISSLFFYLFYLSIPTLYNKSWVQNTLESKLKNDFNINFSVSSDISYNILPSPHFLIKNSKIFDDNKENPAALSEIKNLKVFISQKNLFIKKKINLNKIEIDNANFSFKNKDLEFLKSFNNKKFSNKKIKISKSNIFYRNNENETISIIKISRGLLFYDNLKLFNLIELKGKVFKIPFTLKFTNDINNSNNKELNIDAKKIELSIYNKLQKKSEDLIEGINIFSIMNSKIHTKYNIKNEVITLESKNSKIKNSNVDFKGGLSFKPFDFQINVILKKYELSKLFDVNSIMMEFIKTKLLFNENISTKITIDASASKRESIFDSTKIYFNANNGKLDLDKTKLINNKIGFLQLNNSNFLFKNDKLILNSDILIKIKDYKKLFSFLQTPKKARKKLDNILINIDYDFSTNEIDFNRVLIDNIEVNNETLMIIDEFNFEEGNNLNKSRRLFNRLLSAYDG